MNNKQIFIVIATLVGTALLGGCQRVALDCDYTIVPNVQMYQGGVGNTPSDLSAYAFYGSKDDFHISASYDSIAMGQLWNHKKGEYVLCNVHEMQRGSNIILPLHATTSVVVVCVPEYKIFAWREVTITENLWNLQIPIWFEVWRRNNYKSSSWQFVFPQKEEDSQATL